jgi:endoglucanase
MGIEMGGYLQDPSGQKALVKTVVDAAIQEGVYVIIDWHDHNAHLHERQAVEFFSEMAETYKDTPNVIFELYNEPIGTPWPQIKRYAEKVTAAIRAKGAEQLVVVGTPTWSQDVDQAAADPLQDANVAYTLHFYASTHKAGLRAKAKAAIDQGIALFVTEFGTTEATGDGYVDLAESDLWMKFMDEYKISWANWSLNDKSENASALRPGSSPLGGWSDSQLTTSGRYIKKKILEGTPR